MSPIDYVVTQWVVALPLADGVPPMSAELAVRIVSRAIHIVAAMILGGGIFYLRFVLSPAGADACFAGRRQVWARWVALASAFLILTGLYNFIVIVQQSKAPGAQPLPPTYHMLFGIKFLLSLGVMAVASIVAGKTAVAEKARIHMSRWLNLAWIGVLAIAILGAMLRVLHA